MTKFKVGDIVYLKSGSQRMCVSRIWEDDGTVDIVCMPFGSHVIIKTTLSMEVLRLRDEVPAR